MRVRVYSKYLCAVNRYPIYYVYNNIISILLLILNVCEWKSWNKTEQLETITG